MTIIEIRGELMGNKKPRRVHEVKASFQVGKLMKAGSSLNLVLFADRQKLGELLIGRGSLYWYGRNRQKRKRIDWSRFADMMDELAYGGSRD